MRDGHADTYLRGYGKPAGADKEAASRRSQERRYERMWGTHSHRCGRTYTAEPENLGESNGKPRDPDG